MLTSSPPFFSPTRLVSLNCRSHASPYSLFKQSDIRLLSPLLLTAVVVRSTSMSPLLFTVAVRASHKQQIMTDMSEIIKFHRTGLIWIKSSFCYSFSFIFNISRKMCVYLIVYHAFARSRSSWHEHHRYLSIADARFRCHLPRYCSFCVRTRQALWEWLISIRMEMSLAGVFTLSQNIRHSASGS